MWASDGKSSAADIFPVALVPGAGTFKNDDNSTQMSDSQPVCLAVSKKRGSPWTCVKVVFKQTLVVTNLDFLNIL